MQFSNIIHYNIMKQNRKNNDNNNDNDQLERKQTGQNGFLVAQITVKRMKTKAQNKDQPTKNHKKITEK